MNNADLVQEIITSPEAERMLEAVTKDFYNNSRTGLWMLEVIGREYDDMAKWSKELKREAFPQTCTWSISIWEFIYEIEPDDTLPLEYRRQRIIAKRLSRPPINPARIETVIFLLTNCPVKVTDPIKPYMFMVEIYENINIVIDYRMILKTLRKIKPSHLSFELWSVIEEEHETYDYMSGALSETIHEFMAESGQETGTVIDYNSAAIYEVIEEEFIE